MSPAPMPLEDWQADFLRWYTARHLRSNGHAPSPRTVRGKASRIRSAMEHLGLEHQKDLAALVSDRQSWEVALDRLYAVLAPGSVRLVVVALADFGRWANATGLMTDEVVVKSTDAPTPKGRRTLKVYTQAEVDALLGASLGVSVRFHCYLVTLAETGRRAQEVLDLRYDWLRLTENPPHAVLPTSKNHRPQVVPFSSRLMRDVFNPATIHKLQTGDQGMMGRSVATHPFPWNHATVLHCLQALCRRAGLNYLGLHAFRHYRATSLLRKGVPSNAVAKLLGQTTAVLEQTYDHSETLDYAAYLD